MMVCFGVWEHTMKNVLMAAAIASLAGAASADVYADSVGDINAGTFGDFTHLDIAQVEVTNDATWLYFDITVAAMSADWGKYLVGIDTGLAGSSDGAWPRNIDWGGNIDHFVGSWADSGTGAEVHAFSGAWGLLDATYAAGTDIMSSGADHGINIHRIAVSLSSLGLSVGDSFNFDVATSGGGDSDPGVDHLSLAGEATPDWGTGSASGALLSYTVVPTPSSLALFGLGGLVAGRRRR